MFKNCLDYKDGYAIVWYNEALLVLDKNGKVLLGKG